MKKLENKIVLITGASSGIGEACAHEFASQGARLVLCARRSDRLIALQTRLQNKFSTESLLLTLDVTDRTQVKEILSKLPSNWKNIDVLVNNAGLAAGLNFFHEYDVDDFEKMIDTNLKGLLYVSREIVPTMVERKTGHIIMIGSIAGHEVYPKGAVYAATKHAVNALSRALRLDLLGTNVRVTSIDPGMVNTEFSTVRLGDATKAAAVYKGLTPLSAQDVADAVVYAATRPAHVNISEMIIMPTDQASIVMTHRRE